MKDGKFKIALDGNTFLDCEVKSMSSEQIRAIQTVLVTLILAVVEVAALYFVGFPAMIGVLLAFIIVLARMA